uniref:Uncharacterized protein n=1 Tax=Oryza barthii TaxID=65489 RepID=A0A0D3HT58_9ORYZ
MALWRAASLLGVRRWSRDYFEAYPVSSGDSVLLRRRVALAVGLLRRSNLWKDEGESLMVVLVVWWREGLSYSSPRQQIDGEGGGGGVLADAKDVEEVGVARRCFV